MKILGIDYGERKIGLAVAEDGFVEPFGVVTAGKVVRICQQEGIGRIVIGLPRGEIVKKVKKFKRDLKKKINLPIEFQDETLTSKDAVVKMVLIGKKKKYRQSQEDAVSAALILESYLEKKDN